MTKRLLFKSDKQRVLSHALCSIVAVLFFVLLPLRASAQMDTLCSRWVDLGNGCSLLDTYWDENVTFEWSGGRKDGKADGYGTAKKYLNGELVLTYQGTYVMGVQSGRGTLTYPDGMKLSGSFVDGQLMGYGTMEGTNGTTYSGNFVNACFHGNGKIRWGNGSTFEGFFVSDAPYTGKFTSYDGNVSYLQRGEIVERLTPEPESGYSPEIGKQLTEYFDKDWNRCGPKAAAYYRIITYAAPHIPKGVVKDFYITGELQGRQRYAWVDYDDEGKNFIEGSVEFYNKDGKLSGKHQYYNGKLNGIQVQYHKNGNYQSLLSYSNGDLHGVSALYNEDGSMDRCMIYRDGELVDNKYIQIDKDTQVPYFVYQENFESNSEQWEQEGQSGSIVVNDPDKISFSVAPGRTVAGGIYANFKDGGETLVGVHFTGGSKDVGVGVLFGFKDWDNYYSLCIRGKQYVIKSVANGREDGNKTGYITAYKPGDNTIAIANINGVLTITINGVAEEQFQRPDYPGNTLGLCVENYTGRVAHVSAEYLSIQEIITSDEQLGTYIPRDVFDVLSEGGTGTEEGSFTSNSVDDNYRYSGSGFFVNENGYIATNYHVVEGAKVIQATFQRDGKMENRMVEVVATDKQNDLAILKVKDVDFKPMPPIPYGLSTYTKDTGSEVFTLGYPMSDVLGQEVKLTDGKISSRTGIQGDPTVYQISVPIQHGNSGGPLFDTNGSVVGITSATLNRDYYKAENVNYAVKALYLTALAETLPAGVSLPQESQLKSLSLTEKIKRITPYVVFLQVGK